MKKVVVVLGGGKTVIFEGGTLQVDNNSNSSGYLVVKDMDKPDKEQVLAVFRSWRYWREIDDVGSGKKETEMTYGETDKIRIINKDGLCVATLYILPDGNLKDDSWMHSKDSDWYKRNNLESSTTNEEKRYGMQ